MTNKQIEAALEKWFVSEGWDIQVNGDRFVIYEADDEEIEINLTELAKFIIDSTC